MGLQWAGHDWACVGHNSPDKGSSKKYFPLHLFNLKYFFTLDCLYNNHVVKGNVSIQWILFVLSNVLVIAGPNPRFGGLGKSVIMSITSVIKDPSFLLITAVLLLLRVIFWVTNNSASCDPRVFSHKCLVGCIKHTNWDRGKTVIRLEFAAIVYWLYSCTDQHYSIDTQYEAHIEFQIF